jgi:GTP-binding protein Era
MRMMSDTTNPADATATPAHRAGFVTLVGRPNVGKSTLLNRLVGTKLAAVSAKPQTTRNRIVGIVTRPEAQIVLVDTPGIHGGSTPLNSRMVATARQSLGDADAVVLVVDGAAGIGPADRDVIAEVAKRVRVVAVNKSDVAPHAALLPACAEIGRLLPDAEVVPVSGLTGDNVERLLSLIIAALPPGENLYPAFARSRRATPSSSRRRFSWSGRRKRASSSASAAAASATSARRHAYSSSRSSAAGCFSSCT